MPDFRVATKIQNKTASASYELDICDYCDLPFNDYSGGGICQSCDEQLQQPNFYKDLSIKRGWLALARAIYFNENTKTALNNVLLRGDIKTLISA